MARPKNLDKLDLISLDEAVITIMQFFKRDKPVYSRRTLQNKICKREIHRYGPRNLTLVDKNEILQKLCYAKVS